MFTQNVLVKTSVVAEETRLDRLKLHEMFKSEAHAGFLPAATDLGASRKFTPLQFALTCLYADLLRFGLAGPLAAKLACRLKVACEEHPAAEQLTLTALTNGGIAVLPTESVDLSTGNVSGGQLAFAMVFDLRGYGERVARVIDGEPRIVGEAD